jgi:hypothetical protein
MRDKKITKYTDIIPKNTGAELFAYRNEQNQKN